MTDYIPYEVWVKCSNEKDITVYDNQIAKASSIDEAVFIRRIIFLWEKCKHDKEMFIVPKKFAEPVGMSIHSFRKIVKQWEKKKIIKTKNKGLPLKKWYRINEKLLAKHISELKGNHLNPQVTQNDKITYSKRQLKVTQNDKIYNKNKVRESNTVVPKGSNGLISSKNADISKSFDYRMSSKLYESLAKKRKIMRKVDLVRWSKQFAKFRIDNNLSKMDFKKTLMWYCKNIGGEFVPRAYAAKSFCDKYVRILDAKEPPKDKSMPQEEQYERFKVDEYGNAY